MQEVPITIESISSIYESEPLYYESPNWFYNLVLKIKTALSPYALFIELKKIELQMGRKKSPVMSDRPIDLDIVFYEDLILESEVLQIPHPRALERAFVIVPACEIDPYFKDPISKKTLYEIYMHGETFFKAQKLKAIFREMP